MILLSYLITVAGLFSQLVIKMNGVKLYLEAIDQENQQGRNVDNIILNAVDGRHSRK
jgi:hypothetical protein